MKTPNHFFSFSFFSLSPISNLRTANEEVNCTQEDIHSNASIFKMYLRELPEPLLTFALYEEFLHLGGFFSCPLFHSL